MQNYKKISKHKEKCSPFGGIMLHLIIYIALKPDKHSTQTGQAQHSNRTSAALKPDKRSTQTGQALPTNKKTSPAPPYPTVNRIFNKKNANKSPTIGKDSLYLLLIKTTL